ncbi:GNAT family N-acetyltransferase [Roseovarius sp. D22-M7]|uniref:GNAT family N-acetyltransferase n=1 Tax=Roseovarius sp. D22-M7 TaxID=3127116 RepID=UPI00300FEF20
MTPETRAVLAAAEATWPPAGIEAHGPATIREGRGGGKRVSAATATRALDAEELARAEDEMRDLGQDVLFRIRAGDEALDADLAARGYRVVDPTNIHVAPIDALTVQTPPRVTTFSVWEPLEIMREIWAEGGIGPDRVAVMERVEGPKTGLFGRHDNRPAAAGFVAVDDHIAVVHALEVRPTHRRAGLGRWMMIEAAHWAARHGAQHLAVLCTTANAAANGLYSGMGFAHAGGYHYRVKDDVKGSAP